MQNRKKQLTAFFLCLFFGLLGMHRFYLKRHWTALLMLCTFGGIGIWYLIDLARLALGKDLANEEKKRLLPG